MLYDRSYMKSTRSFRVSSVTDILIISLIAFFLLFSLVGLVTNSGQYVQYLAFSPQGFFNGYVWTPISYGFFHEGPIHLVFNLIGLHLITRQVESEISTSEFYWLILLSLIFGSAMWSIFNVSGGVLIGTSALVLGSLTLFCLRRPDQALTLLPFPITLKSKIILCAVLGFELYGFIFSELRSFGNVAHSAHLGGMIAGAFCFYRIRTRSGLPSFKFVKSSRSTFSKNKKRIMPSEFSVDLSNQEKLQTAVDEILDKINEKGFGSLTAKEKKILDKAKGLLRK